MSRRLFVATRKGVFTVEPVGRRWTVTRVAFVGDNASIVAHDARDGSVYVALDHGHFGAKVHRSADGGATFQEVATPAYPEAKPEELNNDMWGKPIPWKLVRIWALDAGHTASPDVLWCGTLPGGLFRSDDRGASWSLVRPLWDHPDRKQWFGGGADLPGIHSICQDPRDPQRFGVGVSCGGYWVTGDAGASWQCRADGMRAEFMPPEQQYNPVIQDPHLVVRCPAEPDHLWAQHHNGIFRSTNDAASWSEITDVKPSVFGFAVAVHPRDPQTAWFVPAVKDEKRYPADGKVVVNRTRDGGKSFETLTKGLPQEHAYDLTFRHALDVDRAGECLAFGSTTGSLWVSEDQGDSWQAVSEHLPPVYCVRFAK
jgi:hypothetical protein